MIKRCFFIFLLILLIFPAVGLAEDIDIDEEIRLSQKDTLGFLHSLIQVITNEWIEITTLSDCRTEDQAALITIKKTIKNEVINYLLVQAPKEVAIKLIKITLKVVYLFYTGQDLGDLISQIEKMTVNEAKKYAMEWLLQKEIRVAAGNLTASYKSCKGNKEDVVFPYIIIYKPIDNTLGEVGISIYSSKTIEPPIPTWKDPWEGGLERLDPFMVKINGIAKKGDGDTYRWTRTPQIEVSFDEEVPELDFPKLSFWQRTIASLKEKLKAVENAVELIENFAREASGAIKDTAKNVFDKVLDKIKSFFSKINPFKAAVAPVVKEIEEEGRAEKIEELKLGLGQAEEELVETWFLSAGMVDRLDDISEEIDVLVQEVVGLTGEGEEGKVEEVEEIIEEIVEEAEEIIEEEIEEAEVVIEEVTGGEAGEAGAVEGMAVVICQIVPGDSPTRDKVVINEVAWMGTETSSADEWLELKNISSETVNLSGWQLLDKDNQIKIVFGKGVVEPGGFYLLERTDDTSVPHILADLIYTGPLNDNNEALYLFGPDCQLGDMVEAFPDWPAGDKLGRKSSMERSNDFGWHTFSGTSQSGIWGTPRAENSQATVVYYGGGGGGTPPEPPPETETQPLKILITEVQIEGEKANYDFIELYNPENQAADISGWQLKKKNQSGNEYSVRLLPQGSIIEGQSYFLWVNSKDDYDKIVQADASSTAYLTTNNSIAILNQGQHIIDALAWGDGHTNPFLETVPFPENPKENQSLERKKDSNGNYIDTDNNSENFELQNCPNPKGQVITCYSPPEEEEPPEEEPPEEEPPEEQPPEEPQIPTVAINEIAWMGTKADWRDEWLELKNNTLEPIEILNWQLIFQPPDPGEEPRITTFSLVEGVTPSIDGLSYFLLERTDDTTVSDIPADYIFKLQYGWNDDGGVFELRDSEGALIDTVDCRDGWFAGQKTNRISMERIEGSDPANWKDNNLIIRNGRDAKLNDILGTPRAENSGPLLEETVFVDDDFEDDSENHLFNTIEEGVGDASDDWQVLVFSGTYKESVLIEKPISLRGIDLGEGEPVLDATTYPGFRDGFIVKKNGLEIEGFKIINAAAGIHLISSNDNTLKNNLFEMNSFAIALENSNNNKILENIVNTKRYAWHTTSCGIYLNSSNNNILQKNITNDRGQSNATDHGPTPGIFLLSSNNNILENNISHNNKGMGDGIYLQDSHQNIVKANTLTENSAGLTLVSSKNNILENNLADNNLTGIYLAGFSEGNILRGNRASRSCVTNFDIAKPEIDNDIDTTNLVEGKPIYYLQNQSGLVIDSSTGAGLVYCLNCNNVTIKDLIIDGRNNSGIYFYQTNNSFIQNVKISNNVGAIILEKSNNNLIEKSFLRKNFRAVGLSESNNNKISDNIFEENDSQGESPCFGTSPIFAIHLEKSSQNEIFDNLILNNPRGIELIGSSLANTIWQNTLENNDYGVNIACSSANLFYHNNFVNNQTNNWGSCAPYPPINQWYHLDLKEGNYYTDYDEIDEGCYDLNNNNICDDPFPQNNDQYPFLQKDGWQVP